MKTLIVPGSRSLGPPRDWNQALDGECGDLAVVDHIDLQSGQNFMFSFYRPTEEEIAAFLNGGVLRLGIMGSTHPVINMAVFGPTLSKELGCREGFDMGPVLEREEKT